MSLHALRNIGFRFDDQNAAKQKWQSLMHGYNVERLSDLPDSSYDDEFIYVRYFQKKYRICRNNGKLEKEETGVWTNELFQNEALVIYHLLLDVKPGAALSGAFCPEAALDPVRVRMSDRMDPLLKDFAVKYEGQMDFLKEQANALKGTLLSQGDLGYEFYPFSFFPVRLVLWAADEDFPAQLQIFVDENSTQYLHYEAVSFVIADLLTKLSGSEGI